MSPLDLQQFVPSHVCLKCDGCCRFKTADSSWRPKVGQEEKAKIGMAAGADFTDAQAYIKTIEDCGNQLCRFFNKGDSTCQIYDRRPLECALYPFILSKHAQGVQVYVHLACPYIQDHQSDVALENYIDYLRTFFAAEGTRDFLRKNRGLLHDYTPFDMELKFLFTLEGFVL